MSPHSLRAPHTARKWQTEELSPGCQALKPLLLTTESCYLSENAENLYTTKELLGQYYKGEGRRNLRDAPLFLLNHSCLLFTHHQWLLSTHRTDAGPGSLEHYVLVTIHQLLSVSHSLFYLVFLNFLLPSTLLSQPILFPLSTSPAPSLQLPSSHAAGASQAKVNSHPVSPQDSKFLALPARHSHSRRF